MEIEQSLKEDIGTLENLFRILKAEVYLKQREENELRRMAEEFEEPVITINHKMSNNFKITEKEAVVKTSDRYKANARILEISMQLLKEPIEIVCMNLLIAMMMLEEAHCIALQKMDNEKKNMNEPIVRLYTSRNGYYKKKSYQEKCKKYGIECEVDEKKGFANETPSESFIKTISELNVVNYKFVCSLIEKPPVSQRFIIYQCPDKNCNVKVRGTKGGLHLLCNDVEKHENRKYTIMKEIVKE